MGIEKLLEDLSNFDDVDPSDKMVRAAEKIKSFFETLTSNVVTLENRPCLKQDLGDDYPVVSVCIIGEGEDLLQAHVYPKNPLNLDGELKFGLYSDIYLLDEIYTNIDELEKTAKEVLSV